MADTESERWRDFEKLSDFEIIIGKEVFKVHKTLLTWKSPCFKDFLITDQQRQLELTDCDLEIFKIFLNYLYTEKIDDKDVSIELLFIANKFKVKSLVKICEYKLCSLGIKNENVTKLLLAGIKCGCKVLKRQSALYVMKNLESLRKDSSWDLIFENEKAKEALFDTTTEGIKKVLHKNINYVNIN